MVRFQQDNDIQLLSDIDTALLADMVFDLDSPGMKEMLEFRFPCGMTGHELDGMPLNECDLCQIDTILCVEYYVNGGLIRSKSTKAIPRRQLTFVEYVTFKAHSKYLKCRHCSCIDLDFGHYKRDGQKWLGYKCGDCEQITYIIRMEVNVPKVPEDTIVLPNDKCKSWSPPGCNDEGYPVNSKEDVDLSESFRIAINSLIKLKESLLLKINSIDTVIDVLKRED